MDSDVSRGSCGNCFYFDQFSDRRKDSSGYVLGECKRFPPMFCATSLDHKPWYHPDVREADYCGEFRFINRELSR